MDVADILLLAGLLVFAAHFFAWLFSFTKVPDVLLLIIVGIIVGPVLGWISPEFFGQAGGLFSLLVLAIILFVGGTQLRLDVLSRSLRGSTALTVVSFLVSMAIIGFLVWYITAIPLIIALAFGAILAETSSAIVIPLLQGITASDEAETSLALESALSDVLSVVVATALLTAFAVGQVHVTDIVGDILIMFVGATVIGLLGGLIWSLLLGAVRHLQHSLVTTPAFMLVLFGLAEASGLSGPIAALAFGVTLGNVVFFKLWLERKHVLLHTLIQPLTLDEQERSFFSEIEFLLQTAFFVFLGISMPINNFGVFLVGAGITLAIFAVRIPVVRMTSPVTASAFDRMYMAAIIPRGLAATVLATLLAQGEYPSGVFLRDTAYMVILLSIVLTSVLVFLVSKTPLSRVYQAMTGGSRDTAVPLPTEPSVQ